MNCFATKTLLKASSFTVQGHDDGSATPLVPMFPQINPLPAAQRQLTVYNGYGNTVTQRDGLDIGGHIISAFKHMAVIMLILRHKMIEVRLHVAAHGRIGIFIDAEAGAGVLNKEMGQPRLESGQFG